MDQLKILFASQWFWTILVAAIVTSAGVAIAIFRWKNTGSGPTPFGWVALLVSAVAVGIVVYALLAPNPGFGMVAALVLVGLVAITGFVSALSVTASRLGILDSRHPFGLPEGSIRAILTFAFIVLVGVFASYLLVQTSRQAFTTPNEPMTLTARDRAEAHAIQSQLGQDGLVIVSGAGDTFKAVLLPRTDYRLADDVAKQILTMLSTMLAAMIGFYFGSRPNETPVDPHAAERALVRSELQGLTLRAPTYDQVKKAADEKSDTGLTDQQKARLGEIRARIAAVGEKIDVAGKIAADNAAPIDKVRSAKAAALEAHATLAAELNALEALKPP